MMEQVKFLKSTIVRGTLGLLTGLLLVINLPTYGGIGINLLFFAADRGVPPESTLYRIVGMYSLTMTVLLVFLALLLISDFTSWKPKHIRSFKVVTGSLMAIFSLIHVFSTT